MGKKKEKALKDPAKPTPKLPRKVYESELLRLQEELVVLADWVKREEKRVVVLFEGRDAAGKGGVIKRITEYTPARVVRVVALPAPTEREEGQWYFQRYAAQLPAAGEMVLFDRSWYNRAGVERVMGFCTDEEHALFLRQAPDFERMLREDGIILIKYWFSVSDDEQEKRFRARLNDPLKQWKLSPMDLEAQARWVDYSQRQGRDVRVHRPARTHPGTSSSPTRSATRASTASATCWARFPTHAASPPRSSCRSGRATRATSARPARRTATSPMRRRASREGAERQGLMPVAAAAEAARGG